MLLFLCGVLAMSDVWCWLGLTDCTRHASDAVRATPEIAGAVLGNAVALVAGGLAILDGRRTNGGRRKKRACHRGHDLSVAYVRADGSRECRDCAKARAQRMYQARMARRKAVSRG